MGQANLSMYVNCVKKLLGCGFELSCIISVGRSYTADANILSKSRT